MNFVVGVVCECKSPTTKRKKRVTRKIFEVANKQTKFALEASPLNVIVKLFIEVSFVTL